MPFFVKKAAARRYNTKFSQEEYTLSTYRPLPGSELPKPKPKPPTVMTVCDACSKLGYSLASIDRGVAMGSYRLFRKAGNLYIELL